MSSIRMPRKLPVKQRIQREKDRVNNPRNHIFCCQEALFWALVAGQLIYLRKNKISIGWNSCCQ
jgi:hypothetical protein